MTWTNFGQPAGLSVRPQAQSGRVISNRPTTRQRWKNPSPLAVDRFAYDDAEQCNAFDAQQSKQLWRRRRPPSGNNSRQPQRQQQAYFCHRGKGPSMETALTTLRRNMHENHWTYVNSGGVPSSAIKGKEDGQRQVKFRWIQIISSSGSWPHVGIIIATLSSPGVTSGHAGCPSAPFACFHATPTRNRPNGRRGGCGKGKASQLTSKRPVRWQRFRTVVDGSILVYSQWYISGVVGTLMLLASASSEAIATGHVGAKLAAMAG